MSVKWGWDYSRPFCFIKINLVVSNLVRKFTSSITIKNRNIMEKINKQQIMNYLIESGIKEGAVVDKFYSTGEYSCTAKVTRITNSSIFHVIDGLNTERRDSINTVKSYLDLNIWKIR